VETLETPPKRRRLSSTPGQPDFLQREFAKFQHLQFTFQPVAKDDSESVTFYCGLEHEGLEINFLLVVPTNYPATSPTLEILSSGEEKSAYFQHILEKFRSRTADLPEPHTVPRLLEELVRKKMNRKGCVTRRSDLFFSAV